MSDLTSPAPVVPIPRSRAAANEARSVIPGGVNSNFRRDVTFQPIFFKSGRGARLTDIDDNEYIDYALSYGPSILGHDNAHFREALHGQVEMLYSPETSLLEQRAAALIVKHVPSAEQVRFNSTGSEANYNALRIARAHTGRTHIVRFTGHYHGGTDELLGGIVTQPFSYQAGVGEFPDDLYSCATNTAGRAPQSLDTVLLLEWNNVNMAEKAFAAHSDEIAGVLLEPIMLNNGGIAARPEFLSALRRLCDEHGAVLIFDEVVTGFRCGLGGAQATLGVLPDLTTLAKALGNGMPVSAVCGRRDIMASVARAETVIGGTYNGHPLCMAAIIATIEELERDDGAAFKRIEKNGTRFRDGLLAIAERLGIPLTVMGIPGAWILHFVEGQEPISHEQLRGFLGMKAAQFGSEMRRRGVLTTVRLCTSVAHEANDVDEALNRAEDAMRAIA